MNVKELFEKGENGALTYDQFKQFASEVKAKFVDLSEGEYVAKNKYTDDLAAKDSQIETLNGDIKKRDEDLHNLQAKLTEAGNDATKLGDVSSQLSSLQAKYDEDMKSYKAKLEKQGYEFAVKEFANTKNFTSNAAKRDFINEMMAKNLTMEDGKILGAEDFVTTYSTNNADAFKVDEPANPEPEKPSFAGPTHPGKNEKGDEKNAFHFSFQGVRPRD